MEWGVVAAGQPALSSPAYEQSLEKGLREICSLLLGWALSPSCRYTSLSAECWQPTVVL